MSLVFVACHPILAQEPRAALTLRLVGGLTTDEIARAFLVPSATIGQRISRAKRTLSEAEVPFAVPDADELPARLSTVLEVVYLIFNEGYVATSGDRWIRRDLAEQAMRLGRMLTGLMPAEPEVHGLVALMALQASRFPARTGPGGQPVLLPDQDRSRWDRTLIAHGLAALARVVRLNRAVAVLHVDGPQAALAAVASLRDDPRMARYHLLGAVCGDLLGRLGRHAEAAEELERAAGLAPTRHERATLMERAAAAVAASTSGRPSSGDAVPRRSGNDEA